MTLNVFEEDKDYALFLPAISNFYVSVYSKVTGDSKASESFSNPNRIPAKFDKGWEGLNFLDENSYWYYPRGLYSAGHAQLDLTKAHENDSMIQNRDREKTILVGDSGGFQIAKGVLKFDWNNFKGPEADVVREKILRWLEYTTDWSMTLDVPGFACLPPYNKATGLESFEQTVDLSIHNLEYFMENRVNGATKFLNVLSGSTRDNCQTWEDAVISFSNQAWIDDKYPGKDSFEGYAMAGLNANDIFCMLTRLLSLWEMGLLHDKDWIHVLGTGKLEWGCYLTTIQRQIRKHVNKNLTISYDCASPFVQVAFGGVYTQGQFESSKFGYSTAQMFDNKKLKGSDIPLPFKSPIGDRLTLGDISVNGVGDLNAVGKEAKSSFDSVSYFLMQAHNCYKHIEFLYQANRFNDGESVIHKPSVFTDWRKLKKNDRSDEYSQFVPRNILYFNTFMEVLFDTASKDMSLAKQMLNDNEEFLGDLRGLTYQTSENKVFDSLFGDEEEDEIDEYLDADEELSKIISDD